MNKKGGIETRMKRFLRSRKALSPVVAAIILIAVTVAVSIAVAAWMGALTFTFMGTEELRITHIAFTGNQTGVDITMMNTGTTSITLYEVWFGGNVTVDSTVIPANENRTVTLGGQSWNYGYNYQIKVVTTKGNQYYYSAVAPST
ncbi:MAG: archaellin/type IV pilin N-terminal domain-containing protein [Candidatus Bathyarchaeia archaeon]